jgi:hypothetical protein
MIIEDIGKFFEKNSRKLDKVNDPEWKIAIKKCEKHLFFKLMNKTKFGAHTVENLKIPPKDYYLEYAYSRIIDGFWEWKDDFDLTEQLIRIIDSRISTVVKSYKNSKESDEKRENEGKYPLKTSIKSLDIENTFYNLRSEEEVDEKELLEIENDYKKIESFISESKDENIKMFWEYTKEGYKRVEIAELMEVTPKQLDKIKEKFLRQTKKQIEKNGN